MNISGRISRHVNTLVHSYHYLYKAERWNIYFSESFYIFSAPLFGSWEDTLIVSILLLRYQHEAIYLKDSVYSVIASKSTRKQNLITYISFYRASLFSLSFVSYLNQILFSPGRLLGTILGNLKFLNYIDWVDHGRMTFSFPPHYWISSNSQFGQSKPKRIVHLISTIY